MVLSAADYWAAGRRPPSTTVAPASGEPLWRHLVRRQIDSLDLPGGVLRYLWRMHPAVPVGRLRRRLRDVEWPAASAELDSGRLCPLGLVLVRSMWPWRAVEHHQVLAWRHDTMGDGVRVGVYDPNRPGDDGVEVTIGPDGSASFGVEGDREAVVTFFPVRWKPVPPPPD